ncbi:MAG: hypothetical protein IPM83_03745 [Ignavibacteria bacterium]|nr:hypothetical protein [Ignavibacteria bacterium]
MERKEAERRSGVLERVVGRKVNLSVSTDSTKPERNFATRGPDDLLPAILCVVILGIFPEWWMCRDRPKP